MEDTLDAGLLMRLVPCCATVTSWMSSFAGQTTGVNGGNSGGGGAKPSRGNGGRGGGLCGGA